MIMLLEDSVYAIQKVWPSSNSPEIRVLGDNYRFKKKIGQKIQIT